MTKPGPGGRGERGEDSSSADERIPNRKVREPSEIPVSSPELAHAVLTAKRGDSCVVDERTDGTGRFQLRLEGTPVGAAFSQQDQRRRFQPRFDLSNRLAEGRGRYEYPRVSHDGEKFVNARPGYGPHGLALGQRGDVSPRFRVPWGVATVGVDEEVRVQGDHAPRPS